MTYVMLRYEASSEEEKHENFTQSSPKVLALIGQGGIGKTSLAQRGNTKLAQQHYEIARQIFQ